MGMRTIQPVIPSYLLTLIETLRARLRAARFPGAPVLHKLQRRFAGSPVAVRPERSVPRRPKTSFHRSYHFQRRVKKAVF
jgi:hypothetical protein